MNWYGFFIAMGVVVGWWLIRRQVKRQKRSPDLVDAFSLWVIVGGLLGARLWHVATDWSLYASNWQAIFLIWQGGLSVLGAILGGMVGLAAGVWFSKTAPRSHWREWLWWLDVVVFGVPVGQAMGRLGNWVNQELYGLPTNLPWGINIAPEHRNSGYEQFVIFHPLFAYESIGLLIGAAVMWWLQRQFTLRHRSWQVGSGWWFVLYLAGYGWLRFGLEFLRIDKSLLTGTTWGVNQLIVGVVAVIATVGLCWRWWRPGIIGVVLALTIIIGASYRAAQAPQCEFWLKEARKLWKCDQDQGYFLEMSDRKDVQIIVGGKILEVEVVNQPLSISQGLSDRPNKVGDNQMLFLLPANSPQPPSFWMHRVLFALDMVWINEGRVIDITYNALPPSPGYDPRKLPVYQPNQSAMMVLEVPAGFSQTQDWQVGDAFEWYH